MDLLFLCKFVPTLMVIVVLILIFLKNREPVKTVSLNKINIIKKSLIADNFILSLFLVIFFIIGLVLLLTPNSIVVKIIGLFLICLFCYPFSKFLIFTGCILLNKYTVIIDEVIAKHEHSTTIDNSYSTWYILKFKKNKLEINVSSRIYRNCDIGNKYYIVFINKSKKPIGVFDVRKYTYNN